MRLSVSPRRALWLERQAVYRRSILGAVIAVCSCTSLTAPDWTLIDNAAGSGSLGTAGSGGTASSGGTAESGGTSADEGGRAGMPAMNDAAGESGSATGGVGSAGDGPVGGEAGLAGGSQL